MYECILVPIDGSATAERGLDEAIRLAARLHSRLVILHVMDDQPLLMEVALVDNYRDMMNRLRKQADDMLRAAVERATAAGVTAEVRLREPMPARIALTIVEEAGKCGCNLIVMGTHGRRGMSRLAMGSDAELVIRSSTVPVLLVRQPERREDAA